MAETSAAENAAALMRLMTWMSPSFPVGAFSYSHGLETEVEAGTVHDQDTLKNWLEDVLIHGAGWSDAVLCAAAWRAVKDGDGTGLKDVIDLGRALNPSRERLLESSAQGGAFGRAAKAGWAHAFEDGVLKEQDFNGMPYPCAVGAVAAASGLDLSVTLPAFLHGVAANLVSAGVRLVPLGQSDGVRVLAALEDLLVTLAARAKTSTLDDIGGFAPLVDIASMNHETLYTRLFRS